MRAVSIHNGENGMWLNFSAFVQACSLFPGAYQMLFTFIKSKLSYFHPHADVYSSPSRTSSLSLFVGCAWIGGVSVPDTSARVSYVIHR